MTAGVLLLAAGRGRRFGSDKRFVRLPDGKSLLEASLDTVRAAGLPLCVCLRSGDHAGEALMRERDITWVSCSSADQGMGHTIAEGMRGAVAWDAVLIALADMPRIQSSTFRAVARNCCRDRIVAPTYNGKRGHPVGFGVRYFEGLTGLEGDVGARVLLSQHADWLEEVPVGDPGILYDVDRPSDLGISG